MGPRRFHYKGVPVSDEIAMLTGLFLAVILAGAILSWLWDAVQRLVHF